MMRTGDEFKAAIRDGRRVYMAGEGFIDDLAGHAATRGLVDTYAAWYDRRAAPDGSWGDILRDGNSLIEMRSPRSARDLRQMGRAFEAGLLESGGNLTHDPAYGSLIALGMVEGTHAMGRPAEERAAAEALCAKIAQDGTFITLAAGAPTIGGKLRAQHGRPAALKIVEERVNGVVLSGKISMNTATPVLDEALVGTAAGVVWDGGLANFLIPVAAPGVTLYARKPTAGHRDEFVAPLSNRYDEIDAQMWLDRVFVSRERIFVTDGADETLPERLAKLPSSWATWHQLYCWFARAEFTLGLAIVALDAMGQRHSAGHLDLLVDMIVKVQTVRSAITAAELDPVISPDTGLATPNQTHLVAASIAMLTAQSRLTEILRILPGSSVVVAPTRRDFDESAIAGELEDAFGGAGYTALQRAALLNLVDDHANSALHARESAFEQHANGGMNFWRIKARALFPDYQRLADVVVASLGVSMPERRYEDLRYPPR